ncbi:MAG: hypothetical protein ACI4U9_00085 [Clostridia bacterium]
MVEITKDGINYGNIVDKQYKKRAKSGFIKRIFDESKILMYLLGAFFIFAVANLTLIYSFFKILAKL